MKKTCTETGGPGEIHRAIGQIASRPVRTRRSRFYVYASLLMIALVFAGFARSYYLKTWSGAPLLQGLLHGHGLVMSGWLLLFYAQAQLIASHRSAVHRRVGQFGAVWALLVVLSCGAVAIHGARQGSSDGSHLSFLAIPTFDLLCFIGMTGLGLHLRKRPQFHRRLMLMGTLAMMAPPLVRLPFKLLREGGDVLVFGLVLAMAAGVVSYDSWRQRRLHPAFGWSLAALALSVPLRLALGETALWQSFAAWLIA